MAFVFVIGLATVGKYRLQLSLIKMSQYDKYLHRYNKLLPIIIMYYSFKDYKCLIVKTD